MESVMMDKYIDIQEYIELGKEKKSVSLFLFVFLLCFVFSIFTFKIETVYQIEGYVFDGQIVMNINVNDLDKINKGDTVVIEKKKYKYEIYEYEEELITLGENYYKRVKIMVNLEENLEQDYQILKLKFPLQKKNFIQIIIEKITNKEEL